MCEEWLFDRRLNWVLQSSGRAYILVVIKQFPKLFTNYFGRSVPNWLIVSRSWILHYHRMVTANYLFNLSVVRDIFRKLLFITAFQLFSEKLAMIIHALDNPMNAYGNAVFVSFRRITLQP